MEAHDLLITEAVKTFAPPPDITTSEWADDYRYVASGPFPGKWRTDRAPQSKEPMDATSDPNVEGLVVVKPTRSSGTEIVNNCIGRRIHLEPCDVLYVQSTDDMASKYSTEILMKRVINPTPVLNNLISNKIKGRKATETIDRKNYPGGTLHMIGAKSPHKFTMVDYKIVVFDDVAKYEKIKSGDPLELGIGRTKGIEDRLIVMVSNPGIDKLCPLQPYFNMTDQRHRYVPCPRCGKYQVLQFGGKDLDYGLKWNGDDVWYLCEHCHERINEYEKVDMDRNGIWRAHNDNPMPRWRGYKLNPFLTAWQSWRTEIVQRWLTSKSDPDKRKTFITEYLGEWYKPYTQKGVTWKALFDRREVYASEAPAGVLVITIGADVQVDRVEIKVIGWGRDFENWTIEKKIIYGNPADKEIWEDVDRFLGKSWRHESGLQMQASQVFIDSGDGNYTQNVYDFTTPREIRGIYSSKGETQKGRAILSRWSMVNDKQTKLAFVGTDSAKELISSWLAVKEPGAGYCHFSMDYEESDCKQLLSEYKDEKGAWQVKGGQRNEDLDCTVYALAALKALKQDWDELERNMGIDRQGYRVFTSYDPAKHLNQSLELDVNKPAILCVSFEHDICTWLVAQLDNKTIKVLDDLTLRGSDTVRMGRELRKRYDKQLKEGLKFTAYCPEADRTEYAFLSEMGFRQQRVNRNKDIRNNINAVIAILDAPNNKYRLQVHPRCISLKKDLELCLWQKDGSGLDYASGRGYAVTSLSNLIAYEWPLRATRGSGRRFWK